MKNRPGYGAKYRAGHWRAGRPAAAGLAAFCLAFGESGSAAWPSGDLQKTEGRRLAQASGRPGAEKHLAPPPKAALRKAIKTAGGKALSRQDKKYIRSAGQKRLTGQGPAPAPGIRLRFINEQVLKKGQTFGGLKVGGLSALAFDPRSGDLLALCDDKKNHRIYRFSLSKGKSKNRPPENQSQENQSQENQKPGSQKPPSKEPFYKVQLKGEIRLRSLRGENLGFNMDPEGLALAESGFLIASEGQQILSPPEPPQIFSFSFGGKLHAAWPVPSVFWDPLRLRRFGARENKGFESLSRRAESQILWTATEKPLRQDFPGGPPFYVRLTGFAAPPAAASRSNRGAPPRLRPGGGAAPKAGEMLFQYSYPLKDKAAGLSEMAAIAPKILLALERSYRRDKKQGANEISLFLADCRAASDVSGAKALKKPFAPCAKSLVWSSKNQPDLKADNLEGMALIPLSALSPPGQAAESKRRKSPPSPPPGSRLLILASDNNFNERAQKTQFLFFEADLPPFK